MFMHPSPPPHLAHRVSCGVSLDHHSYAELVNVHAGHVFPMPKGMSFLQAACLPETTLTVWNNVFAPGHLKYGDRLLVHGGASGIGTTAIQLARNHGVEVFATAGGACVYAGGGPPFCQLFA